MKDPAARVQEWIHLTTDGWMTTPEAVWRAFGHRIHQAQLIKHRGGDTELARTERRCPPKAPFAFCPR